MKVDKWPAGFDPRRRVLLLLTVGEAKRAKEPLYILNGNYYLPMSLRELIEKIRA